MGKKTIHRRLKKKRRTKRKLKGGSSALNICISTPRSIALIANNDKKPTLKKLVEANVEALKDIHIMCTATTKTTLQDISKDLKFKDTPCFQTESGPIGGDQIIGAEIAKKNVGLLIFLVDYLTPQEHKDDINALLRLATIHDIPTATNKHTAEILLNSLQSVKDTMINAHPTNVNSPQTFWHNAFYNNRTDSNNVSRYIKKKKSNQLDNDDWDV